MAYINDVKYATALSRETVAALAKRYEVSTRVLLRYNENLESERQLLGAGDRIFLQPKRSSFRGRQQWHRIDRGETLMSLSVTYGVSLESLRERNRLTEGVEPVPGSRIKLRGRRVSDSPPVFKVDKIIRPQLEEPADSTPVLEGNKLEEIEGGQVKPAPTDSRPQNSPAPAPVLTQPSTEQNAGGPRPQSPNPANEDPFDEPVPAPAADMYHTVQAGETLWRISQQYGTTVDKIKQLNSLGNDSIRIGMRLKVK